MSRPFARAGLAALLAVLAVGAVADAASRDPQGSRSPEAQTEDALLLVEIPAASTVKYELGEDGLLFVDRFLSMPVAYPANYGSMPSTLAGDGDPLDALVLTRAPLHPGVLVRFRPIGVLRMQDRGKEDAKIIGVPAAAVDPTFAAIQDLGDLAPAERDRIEAFFRVYKDLEPGGNSVRLQGFGDAAEAALLIRQARARHAARYP